MRNRHFGFSMSREPSQLLLPQKLQADSSSRFAWKTRSNNWIKAIENLIIIFSETRWEIGILDFQCRVSPLNWFYPKKLQADSSSRFAWKTRSNNWIKVIENLIIIFSETRWERHFGFSMSREPSQLILPQKIAGWLF